MPTHPRVFIGCEPLEQRRLFSLVAPMAWLADNGSDAATNVVITPTPPVIPVEPVVPVIPVPAPLPTNPAGPDFSGTVKLKLSRNALAGDKGIAVVAVTNSGHEAAIGKMSVEIDLSTDGTTVLDELDTRSNIAVKLKVNHTMVVNLPFTLPATLASGNYIVLSQVDAANQFIEVNETNNTAASAAVAVSARVTTVNASATAIPSNLHAGQIAGISVILSDTGTVAATGLANFTITASGPDGTTQTVLTTVHRIRVLPHGKRGTRLTFRVPNDWVGRYTLQLLIAPTTMTTSLDGWTASATASLSIIAK